MSIKVFEKGKYYKKDDDYIHDSNLEFPICFFAKSAKIEPIGFMASGEGTFKNGVIREFNIFYNYKDPDIQCYSVVSREVYEFNRDFIVENHDIIESRFDILDL